MDPGPKKPKKRVIFAEVPYRMGHVDVKTNKEVNWDDLQKRKIVGYSGTGLSNKELISEELHDLISKYVSFFEATEYIRENYGIDISKSKSIENGYNSQLKTQNVNPDEFLNEVDSSEILNKLNQKNLGSPIYENTELRKIIVDDSFVKEAKKTARLSKEVDGVDAEIVPFYGSDEFNNLVKKRYNKGYLKDSEVIFLAHSSDKSLFGIPNKQFASYLSENQDKNQKCFGGTCYGDWVSSSLPDVSNLVVTKDRPWEGIPEYSNFKNKGTFEDLFFSIKAGNIIKPKKGLDFLYIKKPSSIEQNTSILHDEYWTDSDYEREERLRLEASVPVTPIAPRQFSVSRLRNGGKMQTMKNTNIKKYQQGGGNTINPYRMPFSLFGDAGAMLGSIMAPIGATGSGFSERQTLGRNDYVLNWMKENNYEFAGRDWLGREMVLNKTTGKKERASDIGAPSDAEYTAYSQGNELFNKFLPLTQNMAGLFDLQQKERQELENKKDTVQDFPTNTSTYAPVGFMQDGGGTDPLYDKFPALKSIQSLPKGMSKKHKDMVLSTAFNETQQIAKDMMMQEIQSATYLDRLKKLFPNGAEREQQERLQNLRNTGTKFINFSPDENGYAGLYTPKDFSGKPLVEVTIPGVEPTTFFHEYGHASNKANLAPQEKSYIEKSLKYSYDPVELHTELGQLRQLAKILGVGNFDTNNISSDDVDALESALKNRNDNTSKKNLGVLQRLKKVTKDQNTLPDLFNTIAYNNAPDKLPIARDGGLFRSRTGKILYGGGDLDNLKDEISLDELNKAENDKIELINYINSDSYANRILNYAPPKIQKNPSKASEFVDEFRSRSLLGLDIPVMVGITDGAGEFKGSNIVVSKDYKNDFSNVVKHESGHAYTDPLRELQTGFIFANTKPYNNEVKSSPYAKGVNNRDGWNFVVETEAPAVAHTIRAKMKEFFNIPLGTEITADQYNEFIQEVNSNPEKYKFEKSQIDYLKTMAKNEASELNLINKLASSGNSGYMATMAKNGGFFQKLGKSIGNAFKGVGNVAHDWGLGVADSFGNRLGIYDIDNSKYKTNFGKDVSGFNDKLQSVTGKIGMAVASAAVPGLSGLSGLSGMAGGFNVPNNQQQYSPQQAVGMPSDFQILMGSLPGLLSGLQSPTQSNYTGFFKNGGNSQQVLGYKDISPYKNLPSQIINSNNITMDGVSRTLKLIPDVGQPVVAKGNSGNYLFPGASRVLEVPVAQDGGQPTNNNEEMIMGVIEMLQSVEDLNNRERMAIQKLQELKQKGIDIDEEDFMEAVMEEDYDDDVSPEDFDDDSFEVEDEIEEMKDGGMPQRYKDMGFSKVDTPRRTPKHKTKSHAVVIKDGGKYKLIRFGQQGVSGSPKRKGESKADANRRKSFKARHAKNISKGKTSAAYHANKHKW